MSGELGMFLNAPSVIIVIGGSIFAVMAQFVGQFLGAMKIAGKSFKNNLDDPAELIDQVVELADVARKGGLLALKVKKSIMTFCKKGFSCWSMVMIQMLSGLCCLKIVRWRRSVIPVAQLFLMH